MNVICIFLAVLDVVCESFTLQNVASFSILSNSGKNQQLIYFKDDGCVL